MESAVTISPEGRLIPQGHLWCTAYGPWVLQAPWQWEPVHQCAWCFESFIFFADITV